MLRIPNVVFDRYVTHLGKKRVPSARFAEYMKWLRYFLDFCDKYPVPTDNAERVRLFCEKLKEKKQTDEQRNHAAHAVSLYFAMPENEVAVVAVGSPAQPGQMPSKESFHVSEDAPRYSIYSSRRSQYTEAGYQEKSDSPEWDKVLESMAAEIKVRHYSRKTLKTYALWSRNFQRFLKNKLPFELTTEDVKEYLTFLAVKCKVAASTQNQAFNSLLFLYRHGLKGEFGDLRGVPRAKKSHYVPTVLSRKEIDAILEQLSYPHYLVVKMLFGCGLRLFEGLQLRVGDFNFEAGALTVHGKGKKDRTVPLPESIITELKD